MTLTHGAPSARAVLVSLLLVLPPGAGCAAASLDVPGPAIVPAAESDFHATIDGRPWTYGAGCGFDGTANPLPALVARWAAERRMDMLVLLLGDPNAAVRAFGVAAWLREPQQAWPTAVVDAIAYARTDGSRVSWCDGCLRGTSTVGDIVSRLERGADANPLTTLAPDRRGETPPPRLTPSLGSR
jgi:hypothetical protein